MAPRKRVFRRRRRVARRGVRRGRFGRPRLSTNLQRHYWQYKRSAILDDGDTSSVTEYQIDAEAQLVSTISGIWQMGVQAIANPTAGTPYYYGMAIHPSLELLPNATEFSNLYDQYMFKGLRIDLTPMLTNTNSAVSATQPYGQMGAFVHSCIDYDGGAMPTTSGQGTIEFLKQYTNYKVRRLQGYKKLSYYWKPKTRLMAENANNAVLAKRPMWYDMSTTNIGARQLNLLFEFLPSLSNTDQFTTFRIDVTYYLAFKGQR